MEYSVKISGFLAAGAFTSSAAWRLRFELVLGVRSVGAKMYQGVEKLIILIEL